MPYSARTRELARIFSEAITQDPNNAFETARYLYGNIDPAIVEEILDQMSNPESELSQALANAANAFHAKSSEKAPAHVTPEEIPGMVRKLSVYIKHPRK